MAAVSILVLILVAIGGCAGARWRGTVPPDSRPACASLFARDDARILHAGVRDAQYRAIPGHPGLRIDRFHAAFVPQPDEPAARETWLRQLAGFDTASRRIEHRNLAPDARPDADETAALAECAQRTTANLLADDNAFAALLARIKVDDNYSLWRRALGLYPLAAPFALRGVARLQARERRYFAASAFANPASVTSIAYGYADPERSDQVAALIARASRDALGVPVLDATALARLFAAYSPVFMLHADGEDDRIGRIGASGVSVHVDTADPAVYTYVSHTRFAGTVLVQLNYVVWFPARAPRSRFDIYAGLLDGITWRVTLDNDGSVLLADTMHNCGCYYMAFPGPAIKPRAEVGEFAEPLWIPQALPQADGGRYLVQLSGGEHYVRGVRALTGSTTVTPLRELPYVALKNLPLGDDTSRNLFGPDGLIDESARGERFVLWPLGIRSAGAMREAGHHAIAFVGRRHFDDPDLFDRYFVRVAPP